MPFDHAAYTATLDDIYSSFMRVKDRVKGLHDHAIRDERIILDIADRLDIVPPARRVVRVTGSKGKGTTSRLIARYIESQRPSNRVALFVSPEEFDHVDRMQINGKPIDYSEFINIHAQIRPNLERAIDALKPNGYLSPFGIFYLIALVWFKKQNADFYVLETGRGVIKDEVGGTNSTVSVVTSVLFEHPDSLGPTIEDIAREKLAIGTHSNFIALGSTAKQWNDRLNIIAPEYLLETPSANTSEILPSWIVADDQLARAAVAKFLDVDNANLSIPDWGSVSTSFGFGNFSGKNYMFEAAISADSIDISYFIEWISINKPIALISLPDDKDRDGLIRLLEDQAVHIVEVILEGTRGYLRYNAAESSTFRKIRCHYEDKLMLKDLVQDLQTNFPQNNALMAIGTQTFIRLFKQMVREGTT